MISLFKKTKYVLFINLIFFFRWKDPRETQQYFPTFVDGRGGKIPAILAEGLTPKDSRLKPVTSPRTERVYAPLTNWANPISQFQDFLLVSIFLVMYIVINNSRWMGQIPSTMMMIFPQTLGSFQLLFDVILMFSRLRVVRYNVLLWTYYATFFAPMAEFSLKVVSHCLVSHFASDCGGEEDFLVSF